MDFPGFHDSHGELISIGMELALKALIKKHDAKILLVESITNTENRFAEIGDLARNMKRIFRNKEECLLGMTKYRVAYNYKKVKELREE